MLFGKLLDLTNSLFAIFRPQPVKVFIIHGAETARLEFGRNVLSKYLHVGFADEFTSLATRRQELFRGASLDLTRGR